MDRNCSLHLSGIGSGCSASVTSTCRHRPAPRSRPVRRRSAPAGMITTPLGDLVGYHRRPPAGAPCRARGGAAGRPCRHGVKLALIATWRRRSTFIQPPNPAQTVLDARADPRQVLCRRVPCRSQRGISGAVLSACIRRCSPGSSALSGYPGAASPAHGKPTGRAPHVGTGRGTPSG